MDIKETSDKLPVKYYIWLNTMIPYHRYETCSILQTESATPTVINFIITVRSKIHLSTSFWQYSVTAFHHDSFRYSDFVRILDFSLSQNIIVVIDKLSCSTEHFIRSLLLMKCSVEHESLSITTIMFCEREKSKVLRNIIQQNDKSTQKRDFVILKSHAISI